MNFRPVKDFPEYKISECGNSVIRISNNRKLTVKLQKNDSYLKVSLSKNNKQSRCYIHRLVAFSWQELPEGLSYRDCIVHHKDHDKLNNHNNNLEITTHSQNAIYKQQHVPSYCINKQILIGISENNLKK